MARDHCRFCYILHRLLGMFVPVSYGRCEMGKFRSDPFNSGNRPPYDSFRFRFLEIHFSFRNNPHRQLALPLGNMNQSP